MMSVMTMMINVMRNTCIGTGGSTQHLHHISTSIVDILVYFIKYYINYIEQLIMMRHGGDIGLDVHTKVLLSSDVILRKGIETKCKRTRSLRNSIVLCFSCIVFCWFNASKSQFTKRICNATCFKNSSNGLSKTGARGRFTTPYKI